MVIEEVQHQMINWNVLRRRERKRVVLHRRLQNGVMHYEAERVHDLNYWPSHLFSYKLSLQLQRWQWIYQIHRIFYSPEQGIHTVCDLYISRDFLLQILYTLEHIHFILICIYSRTTLGTYPRWRHEVCSIKTNKIMSTTVQNYY
jgi:hypothetical protein